MKIWVIGRNYPQKNNGMQGSFELEQARMLANAGHQVVYLAVVFHPFKKVKKWGYCSWSVENMQVCVTSHLYAPSRMSLHLKRYQRKRWKRFLGRVEQDHGVPDVIHVHYPSLITVAEEVLRYQEKGAVIAATEHWTKVLTCKIDRFERDQLKQYVENANAFICVGEPLRESVKKLTDTSNEIIVVPNVVSPLFVPSEKRQENNEVSFVATGRLVPVKQFDKIIETFAETFRGINNVHLKIVGGGSDAKKLRKLVDKLGMNAQINLTGTLSREETAEMVQNSDVLICYSRLETFGVPVIEAWACGKPVIASDCLGFLEYWNDELGYIVPWDDRGALEKAMRSICENLSEYDAQGIAAYAQRNFSEHSVSEKLISIYNGKT